MSMMPLFQVKPMTKLQLELWGLDYFDLFLIHFPVALEYVDPAHRFPPEWWGDDKKSVTLGELSDWLSHFRILKKLFLAFPR